MNPHLSLHCPAKVNMALSVGSPQDDGYHPIASWMVAVSLYDELHLEAIDGESSYEIDWIDDAPQPGDIDWPLEKDLAVRAHRRVEQRVDRPLPIRMHLGKRIPTGAGLAGGSTDAAGMLLGLNRLYELGLSEAQLIDLAMQLGSDIAFFFSSGSALVTGRGEALEDAPLEDPVRLTLVMADLQCPTAAVYRAFDEMARAAAVDEAAVREVIAGRRKPFNDLAAAACKVESRLADVRQTLAADLGRDVHITGSGSGLFIVADSDVDADRLVEQLRLMDAPPAADVHSVNLHDLHRR